MHLLYGALNVLHIELHIAAFQKPSKVAYSIGIIFRSLTLFGTHTSHYILPVVVLGVGGNVVVRRCWDGVGYINMVLNVVFVWDGHLTVCMQPHPSHHHPVCTPPYIPSTPSTHPHPPTHPHSLLPLAQHLPLLGIVNLLHHQQRLLRRNNHRVVIQRLIILPHVNHPWVFVFIVEGNHIYYACTTR